MKRFEFTFDEQTGNHKVIEHRLSSELHDYIKVIAESPLGWKAAKVYEMLTAIERWHSNFPLDWLDADRIAADIGITISL